jgi:integrase
MVSQSAAPSCVEAGRPSARHTYVSLHGKNGTPAKVLSELLGHASVATTAMVISTLGDVQAYVDRLGGRRHVACGLFADRSH